MDPMVTVKISVEIDGVVYSGEVEKLRPKAKSDLYFIVTDINDMIAPAVTTHFGFALKTE